MTCLHYLGRAAPLAHSWREENAQPAARGAASSQCLPLGLGISKNLGLCQLTGQQDQGRLSYVQLVPGVAAGRAQSPKPH